MRLTLRTLLCYMDDILGPADQADLGKQIDESEFARDTVRRTRDVIRSTRLGAPQVMGAGMGLDPNTVAEYIDNTMSPDQVAEFEKICLASDVHLAEVAASHQILALVLGQPADVDPASRERMYRLPEALSASQGKRVDPAHTATATQDAAAGSSAAPRQQGADSKPSVRSVPEAHKERRKKPEVPDYLRESDRSRFRSLLGKFALAAVVLFVLVGGSFYLGLFDPLLTPDESHELAHTEIPSLEIDSGTAGEPALGTSGGGTTPAAIGSGTDGTTPAEGGTLVEPGSLTTPTTGDAAPLTPPATSPATIPVEGGTTDPGSPTPGTPAAGVDSKSATAGSLPDETSIPPTLTPTPPATEAAVAPEPATTEPAATAPATTLPSTTEPSDTATPSTPPATATATDGTPGSGEPKKLGIYVADKNVLLTYDFDSQLWRRARSPATIYEGDRLLALPTYRPTVTLSAGVTIQMSGGTAIELAAPDDQGIPAIRILFGRVVLTGAGQAGSQLRLLLEQKEYRVALSDIDSVLAIQVHRKQQPGKNPEESRMPLEADLFAARSSMQWHNGSEASAVQSPAHWRIPEAPVTPPKDFDSLPKWIQSEPLSAVDRRASPALEQALAADRPVILSLTELVEGRRLEVRSLATRCSVYVGHFEPFVASLNDEDQRATWSVQIDTLQDAIALSPQIAARVREAFVHQRGDNGQDLYRMLWSYSDADLKAGAAKQLVKYLDHDNLDYRVLAFWNLRSITGLGLNYRPEYPPSRRQQSVRRWQERLEDGKIVRPSPAASEDAAVSGS